MNILNYIKKKNYNIFESIQLLYDMDCYKDMTSIFKELKDIIPDKIYVNTEGIEDEKILFLLNHLNGCSLESSGFYSVKFIKDNETVFEWNLRNNYFWIDYSKIWGIFVYKYNMTFKEIQYFIKNVLEQYCKLMGVTPSTRTVGLHQSIGTILQN